MITITMENGRTIEKATPEEASDALAKIAKQRAYNRAYYVAHKKERVESQKKYLAKNSEQQKARLAKWRAKHPDYRMKYYAEHRERELENSRRNRAVNKLRKEAEKLGMVIVRPGKKA